MYISFAALNADLKENTMMVVASSQMIIMLNQINYLQNSKLKYRVEDTEHYYKQCPLPIRIMN